MISMPTIKLLNLIDEGKSCNEICKELNITSNQLFTKLTNLRNKGINFNSKYYSSGEITYSQIKNYEQLMRINSKNYTTLITKPNEGELRVLAISDLHFGSSKERVDLVNRAFDYCTKNNINIIFNCGDMIDGTFGQIEKDIEDVYGQIEHFIKDYPFDKNILTFGVAGDHDLSALTKSGQDFITALKSSRQDIIVPSYNNVTLFVKNDKIVLHHNITDGKNGQPNALMLCGHPHKYRAYVTKENALSIAVPSLSDINESIPTALDMDIIFKDGLITNVTIRQIEFDDKDYVLSENLYSSLGDSNYEVKSAFTNGKRIINEETSTFKEKVLSL